MDQPGKVANPARGQLNKDNEYSPVPVRAWEFGLARRIQPSQPTSACSSPYSGWGKLRLRETQAEGNSGWGKLRLRDSSRVPRRRPFMKPPYAIGSVPNLSGHAIAYRWRSLPRVRRHRASKTQGSSERVLPSWQVTMNQLICASLSHKPGVVLCQNSDGGKIMTSKYPAPPPGGSFLKAIRRHQYFVFDPWQFMRMYVDVYPVFLRLISWSCAALLQPSYLLLSVLCVKH